jgi:CRP-like cAMP-binding protein
LSEPKSDAEPAVFSGPEVKALLQAGQSRTMTAHALLCEEGKVTDHFFFMIAGKVEISKTMNGTCRVLATSGPGSVLALMPALDGAACAVSMRAQGEITVVEINRSKLLAMLDPSESSDSNLVHDLTLVAISRLRAATDDLAKTLYQSLRASPRAGRLDPNGLALIHASNHAWPFARLAA